MDDQAEACREVSDARIDALEREVERLTEMVVQIAKHMHRLLDYVGAPKVFDGA